MVDFWHKQGSNRHEYHRKWHIISALVAAALMLALFLLVNASDAVAAPHAVTWPIIQRELIASGFDDPIDLVDPRDGTNRLFVVERSGAIHIIEDGVVLATPFLNISTQINRCDECGLLGLAFPPNFAEAGYFFINYTSNTDRVGPDTGDPNTSGDTVIARFRVSDDPNVADAGSEQAILEINQPAGNHNGGHIVFGPDGYLYIGMGDGGGGGDDYQNAQEPASLHGKLLRIEVGATGTYTVPATNPFTNTAGYRAEIWAEGLRNPWRFNFDPTTGDLYVADVGQGDFEEINHIPAAEIGNGGMNFGWPIMEGSGCFPPSNDNCDTTGLTQPVVTYGHEQGDCSVTGGYVYHSPRPFQAPVYLYADFCTGRLWGMQPDGDVQTSELLDDLPLRVTSFGEDRNGNIYIVSYGGEIYQLVEHALYLPNVTKPE